MSINESYSSQCTHVNIRKSIIAAFLVTCCSTTGKSEGSQDITSWTFVELHSISNWLLRVCCSQGESVVSLAKDRSSWRKLDSQAMKPIRPPFHCLHDQYDPLFPTWRRVKTLGNFYKPPWRWRQLCIYVLLKFIAVISAGSIGQMKATFDGVEI